MTIKQCVAVSCACWLVLAGCHSTYEMSEATGSRHYVDAKFDAQVPTEAQAVLDRYRPEVEKQMSPVIGHSADDMESAKPEGELSNLVADVLKEAAEEYLHRPVDMAVINTGGLRAPLLKGDITVGRIFQVTPFENSLCIVTMTGTQLAQLFENIASIYGMGISGAAMVVSREGKLVEATVQGKPIEADRTYTISTVEYLAQGNDKLTAFPQGKVIAQPEGYTLRGLFIDYVKRAEQEGIMLKKPSMGRVTIAGVNINEIKEARKP